MHQSFQVFMWQNALHEAKTKQKAGRKEQVIPVKNPQTFFISLHKSSPALNTKKSSSFVLYFTKYI